jgi:hypothetical protein
MFIVMGIDYLTSGTLGFFSLGTANIAHVMVLFCWRDMMLKRKPGKNCWEFKER